MGNRPAQQSIVPDQDPLLKSSIPLRRIVHAEISRDFEIKSRVLGTGYSGAVRLAEHKLTGQQVAVKQFSKQKLKPNRLKLLKSEVEVYLRLDHPNICKLLHCYEGQRDVWLVMELCECELYSRLCKSKVYCEEDAADVMRQMLQAVNYLHSQNIVHRDLKLENWMYGTAGSKDRLKLIDFGFSEITSEDTVLQMPCGTLHYTSPEVLRRSYRSTCDLWSMGVICYMLLMGRPPFRGSTNGKIAKAIMEVDFPKDGRWAQLSHGAQDFICGLLVDSELRMTAAEALEHRWLTVSEQSEVDFKVLKSLRTFAQGSNLRRCALTILAYSLTSAELEGLERTFLDFDHSKRGCITLDQLRESMEGFKVSEEEVNRIFESFAHEEICYTPFVAALLETRIGLESKAQAAFEAFDLDGKGYITAESLELGIRRLCGNELALSRAEAEQWISEVDFKGNGVVTYASFLAALMGRSLKSLRALPSSEDLKEQPQLLMSPEGRPRGFTESFMSGSTRSTRPSPRELDMEDEKEEDGRMRSRSFGVSECAERVQIRSMACEVDERYFA